jgi:bifunctional UDP-N-acetylglucosamine pyrophosphorylase/glucosamine-1-phosphate N-acetyltransferase
MSLSIIILAAGQSLRMRSPLPKVLHKVASRAIIDYILETVKAIAAKDTVMVVGHHMDILEDHVRNKNSAIKFALQQKKLGTADAVKSGLSELKDLDRDILILYGDVPFITPETISKMRSKLAEDKKNALVVLGFEAQDPAQYGRLSIDQSGQLKKIIEFLDCNEEEKQITLCNSGVMMVRGQHLEQLISKVKPNNAKGEFYFTDIIGIALEQGLVCEYLITKEEEVAAVNNRKDLAKAEGIIQKSLRNKFLEEGVTMIDATSVYFSADTSIEEDVTIFPNVFIGPGVVIKSGVQIKSFSHLEGATIEKNAIIGPFARIRPGTTLGENVKVGNFVEIKNSLIASGSKISHLSYIGDTEMGSNVNIGAGTITCNYDGFNKHKTTIADNVFVGSNVSLVAPVSIGKGAMIAANSAITEDVGSGVLAIARTSQTNIEDGATKISEKNQILQSKNKPL